MQQQFEQFAGKQRRLEFFFFGGGGDISKAELLRLDCVNLCSLQGQFRVQFILIFVVRHIKFRLVRWYFKQEKKRSDLGIWQIPYTNRNSKLHSDNTKIQKKKPRRLHHDCVHLRTVSWNHDSNQTGVVKPSNGTPTFPQNHKSCVMKRTHI